MVQCSGVVISSATSHLYGHRYNPVPELLSTHVLPVSAWVSWVTSQNMPVGWICYDKCVCRVPCDVLMMPKQPPNLMILSYYI